MPLTRRRLLAFLAALPTAKWLIPERKRLDWSKAFPTIQTKPSPTHWTNKRPVEYIPIKSAGKNQPTDAIAIESATAGNTFHVIISTDQSTDHRGISEHKVWIGDRLVCKQVGPAYSVPYFEHYPTATGWKRHPRNVRQFDPTTGKRPGGLRT